MVTQACFHSFTGLSPDNFELLRGSLIKWDLENQRHVTFVLNFHYLTNVLNICYEPCTMLGYGKEKSNK